MYRQGATCKMVVLALTHFVSAVTFCRMPCLPMPTALRHPPQPQGTNSEALVVLLLAACAGSLRRGTGPL